MIGAFLNFGAYQAHEQLVAPARATAQIWRLVMGIVLVAGVVLLIGQFVNQSLVTLLGNAGYAAFVGADGQPSQLSVLYLLSSFSFLTIGVIVALKVAHQRDFLALLGDWSVMWRQFLDVLTVLALINLAIMVLPPWDIGMPVEVNVPFTSWLLVLPFAVLAILIQVSA
ncbi:MAG: CPBP family intramembrane glutamate endopeptidase, partial [Roseobacter sp.]|nr:CPBP family intramembrane glutamate endopeptidase [Roseobacter sp.]